MGTAASCRPWDQLHGQRETAASFVVTAVEGKFVSSLRWQHNNYCVCFQI